MEYIIETNNLTKKFGEKISCNNISLHIKKGDIYGFIGKNGAGKTTTMKCILGLLNPTSGEIKINDSKSLNKERYKIGSLIEAPGLYKNQSAYENLKRFSIIQGGNDSDIKKLLTLVGLENVGKRKVENFSLGMKQRLGIAIALLGNPEILILDEPINGLDPKGIKDIRDLLIKLNKELKVTIMVSSHLLDELAKITTRYGIINNGTLVEEIDANVLMERCKSNLKIEVNNVNNAILLLNKHYPNINIKTEKNTLYLYNLNVDPALINELLVTNKIKVSELKISDNAFEQYFIERIGI